MTVLVVGASGSTGKLLVDQLLESGHRVKLIVRPTGIIPASWSNDARITILREHIMEICVPAMARYLADCQYTYLIYT